MLKSVCVSERIVHLLLSAVVVVALFAADVSAAGGGLFSAFMQQTTTSPKSADEVERAVAVAFAENPLNSDDGEPTDIDIEDLFDIQDGVEDVNSIEFNATSSRTDVVRVSILPNPHVRHVPVGPGTSEIRVVSVASDQPPVVYSVTVHGSRDDNDDDNDDDDSPTETPALPLVAQGLLAALLLGIAGWRRRFRRQ